MTYNEHIQKAKDQNLPFVAFRNPNENKVQVIVQHTDTLTVFDDFSVSGYVFAPFDDREEAYLIKPDIYFIDEVKNEKESFEQKEDVDKNSDREHHIKIVKKAIDAIKTSELSKIVVARKEEIEIPDFDILQVYNRLLDKYSNAYVYVWFHPKVGLWMGATPETLLNVQANNFKTMALAGTQTFKGDVNPDWGQKELDEQQMVADYIQENLEKIVDNLHLSKVETVKSGNLLHLKTNISGALKSAKDITHLVNLLHPTPAVCGLPKEKSKQFILNEEKCDRTFYSGYLGVLNLKQETSFFVNLRCFQFMNNKALIYVGGGITTDSNAEKEWEETVAKSHVIKSVL